MDNLTIGKSSGPNFGAVYLTKDLLKNPVHKSIANNITQKLGAVNPNDKLGRNYIKQAEDWGYDIFINNGKGNTVRVDLVSTLGKDRNNHLGAATVNSKTLVGNYSKPEQFDIKHFDDKCKSVEKESKIANAMGLGYLGTFIAAIAIAVGSAIYSENKTHTKPYTSPQVTVMAKDSVKSDSIKPILEDTFKLSRKVVK